MITTEIVLMKEVSPLVQSKNPEEYQFIIVCAAQKSKSGNIVCGARHFDSVMRNQMDISGGREVWLGSEGGFIDQRGNFRTRTEAWHIAVKAGQIRRRCGGDTAKGGTLFSENLY